MFEKLSWELVKGFLFSPLGMIAVIVIVWIASGWKHTIEARFECNARVAKLQATFDAAVQEARKFDDERLRLAEVQAKRDLQENAEREAAARKEIEAYAESLKKQLAGKCVLGPDGVRAVGVR